MRLGEILKLWVQCLSCYLLATSSFPHTTNHYYHKRNTEKYDESNNDEIVGCVVIVTNIPVFWCCSRLLVATGIVKTLSGCKVILFIGSITRD